MRILSLTTLTALGAGALLTGCAADSTGPASTSPRSVSLSLAATGARSAASPASLPTSGASLAAIGSSTDSLVITKAQLVFARLELQQAGATCSSGAAAGDDDRSDESCAQLELAPTVVSLPVDGSVSNALSVAVPSGTYSAFEAKIRPVDAKRTGSTSFLAAHPEFTGASVRVEGTFNGKSFTYVGAPSAQLESVFTPPITADSSGINITVKVDLSTWFRTSAGTLIDPATAGAGSANAALISNNIARSLSAFRDDDHNGRDDHGRDGNDGGDDRGQNSGRD